MINIFDSIQDSTFSVITQTFGYDATWKPSTGGNELYARVCYKDATDSKHIGDTDYENEDYVMEFKEGDFPGLKKAVDFGGLEKVRVVKKEGVLEFFVKRLKSKFDGRTVLAFLGEPTEVVVSDCSE